MVMEDCCSEAVPKDQARSSLPHHSVSILEALKAPKASVFMHKSKVDCNPPHKGKRRARGEGSSEPKTVSPHERVREFPDECLTVTGKGAGKLFCNACHENLVYGETLWQVIMGPTSIGPAKKSLL